MRIVLIVVLVVLGLLAIAAGALYLADNAHHLPTFFPGYLSHHTKGKYTHRGEVGIAVGVILLIVGGVLGFIEIRRRRSEVYY